MKKKQKLYEGKAKILYEAEDSSKLIQFFKDDATAFNGDKKGSIIEKGIMNNSISSYIFKLLEERGVRTHYIDRLSDREMLVHKVDIILVEVVVRNVVAGSLSKRMGIKEGTALKNSIVEFYYKNDDLNDPMINKDHIREFGLATPEEIEKCQESALQINTILQKFFDSIGLILVDYKLEFGRFGSDLILADEISPDGCRLWDKESGKKMDKDRFRQNLGDVEKAYHEVCDRVLGAINS